MLNSYNLVLLIVALFFFMGMVTFISGILIIVFRASSGDIKSLAIQTARLAQKGVTEDIAGLVGNASDLIESMNQLVRTTRGVGLFLTFLGLAMMAGASWIAITYLEMQS